jgi:hypothetical protein
MARTVPSPVALADPARLLPGLPEAAADLLKLALELNKLDADGGPPPIRIAWSDGQHQHAGVMTLRHTFPVPEWSPRHTSDGLNCRVRINAFAGAGGVVRFESVNGLNWVDVPVGPGAGWYDAAALLPLTMIGGEDAVNVWMETTAGTLTTTALSCEWPETASPLPAGLNGAFVPMDDAEVDPDRPLSSRLGEKIRDDLAALEARVQVYACYSGVNGVVSGGGVDCSYMPATFHWLWAVVYPGTDDANWRLTWRADLAVAGTLDVYYGPSPQSGDEVDGHTAITGATGTLRLVEYPVLDDLAPQDVTDINLLPGQTGADPLVRSFAMWGR